MSSFRTTIRLAEEIHKRLEAFRDELSAEMGHRVSYQLAISRAVAVGLEHLGHPPGGKQTAPALPPPPPKTPALPGGER